MRTFRSLSEPIKPPETFSPKVVYDAETEMGSDEQPTITVTRKTQGALAVSPDAVTAGQKEVDFTITYTADEMLDEDDLIEVRLPAGWSAPESYQLDEPKPTTAQADSYVYVDGSATRLAGTTIGVINGTGDDAFDASGELDTGVEADGGWIVQIQLGPKGLSKNGAIDLKYDNVTVQRMVAMVG